MLLKSEKLVTLHLVSDVIIESESMNFRTCSALLLAVVLLAACESKQKKAPYTPADSAERSSQAAADSSAASLSETDEEAMPTGADELFDDFFFNFAASKRLQLERTSFPLRVVRDSVTQTIDQRQWKTERFFMNKDSYTLLFDSRSQQDLVKDTTVAHAIVEHIMLADGVVCQYYFNRHRGLWMLDEIRYQQLLRNPNAQFFKFYSHFTTDSVFQRQSLAGQIEFVGPDPEDDFQIIEGVITPDFWDAFAPEFPKNELYNIVYGPQNPSATQKIFVIRGIANELEVEVTFRLQQGRWKVTKLMT